MDGFLRRQLGLAHFIVAPLAASGTVKVCPTSVPAAVKAWSRWPNERLSGTDTRISGFEEIKNRGMPPRESPIGAVETAAALPQPPAPVCG